MITMTCNEAADKYASIVETALFDLQMETMLEAAGSEPSKKKEGIFRVAINAIGKFFGMIARFFKKVYDTLTKMDAEFIIVNGAFEISKAALDYDSALCANGLKISQKAISASEVTSMTNYLDNIESKSKVKYNGGDKIYIKKLKDTSKRYLETFEKMEKAATAEHPDVNDATLDVGSSDRAHLFNRYRTVLINLRDEIESFMNTNVLRTKRMDKDSADLEGKKNVAREAIAKNESWVKSIKNQSQAEGAKRMLVIVKKNMAAFVTKTNKAYGKAKSDDERDIILGTAIETATASLDAVKAALNKMIKAGVVDGASPEVATIVKLVKGKTTPNKMKTKTESVEFLTGIYDTLIEAYTLIEDAEAAQVVMDKADEVQKSIEDIPEETPVEDDDYEDIFDDESSEPDMEAIKDIIGDDKDALELMTGDEDSIIITADDETL